MALNRAALRAGVFAMTMAGLAACAAAKELPRTGLRSDPRLGTLVSLRGGDLASDMADAAGYADAVAAGRYDEAARLWLEAHRAALRLESPAEELRPEATEPDPLGFTHLKYRQVYRGLPVWGSELMLHWNRERRLYLVNGRYLPTPAGLETEAALSPEQVVARSGAAPPADCADCTARLGIYGGKAGPSLAYRWWSPQGVAQRRQWTVDAHSGEVLEDIVVRR